MRILLLCLLLITVSTRAQVVSISPAEEFRGQQVTVVIKLAPGLLQSSNPPLDSTDIYLQQGSARIYSDPFTPADIYPGTPPYTDSLSATFTIPSGATPGWYDVHVITDPNGTPGNQVLANGFVVRLVGSCPVPFDIQQSALTATSVFISWDASVTADTFRIRYREPGSTNYRYKDVDGAGAVTGATVSGLNPGAAYRFDVSTICNGIHSTYSLPLLALTTTAQAANCVIPYSVVYSAVTNTSVTVSWNTNIVADTFRIRYRLTGATAYSYKNVNGSLFTTSVSNLQPASTYEFQVSTVCSGVGNGYSIIDNVQTLSTPVACIKPYSVSSSAITNNSALISWSNLITADTFRIRYSVNGNGNYFYKNVQGSGGSSTTINGLLPGTNYEYQVSSICSGVGSGYSAPLNFTTTNTPVNCTMVPYSLSSTVLTNTSATISWTNMVTADSFLVRYAVTSTTNYIWKMVAGTAGNSVTLTGLTPNTSYTWQVRTKCNLAPPTPYSAPDVFSTPLRLSSKATTAESFNVFPNPSSGKFFLEIDGYDSESLISISDIDGQIVFSRKVLLGPDNNLIEIELKDFSNGVYFVTVNTSESLLRKRIVLQK